MKKILFMLDIICLAVVEHFSHRLQRQTGKTNFFWAKIAMSLTALACMANIFYTIGFSNDSTIDWSITGTDIILAAIGILTSFVADSMLKRELMRTGLNALKFHSSWRVLRISFVLLLMTFCLMSMIGWEWSPSGFRELATAAYALFMYLISSEPLPNLERP